MTRLSNHVLQQAQVPTRDQLKEILAQEGPCITLVTPLEGPPGLAQQDQVRMRHSLTEIQRRLHATGLDHESVQTLVKPIRDFAEDWEGDGQPGSLVILRSRDLYRVIRLSSPAEESVTVGDHFEIRPILREIDATRVFYILALAQKNVRVLRCTDHSSEEVPLPAGTPTDLQSWAQTRKPDHNLKNKASAGPSSGSSKGIMQSTSTDREDKDEYLLHFYTNIDRAVNEVLKSESTPLVLAGVDYEVALYHRITSYPHIIPDGVHGAADGLKGGEMHKRALEIVRSQLDPGLERALALYEANVGVGKTSHQINAVVKCAYQGRVSHLLLADGLKKMGNFDEATQKVRQHGSPVPGDEDLLNAAALQTILHGGEVYLLAEELVPNHSPIAAVLRY